MTEIVRLPKQTNESGQGPRLVVISNPQAPGASPKLTGSQPRHSDLAAKPQTGNRLRGSQGSPAWAGQPGETGTLSPIQRAHATLIAQISSLAPSIPILPACPQPEDVRAMGAHLWAFAQAADAYVEAIGRELGSAVLGVDLSQFERVLTGALDGNAMFEVEEAAVAVEEGTEIVTGMWAAE